MRTENRVRLRRCAIFLVFVITAVGTLSIRAQSPAQKLPDTEHLIPSLDGPTLYATYCAVCHGKAADGHGPMAPILKTRVPNLTEIAKRNGGTFPFDRVQDTIAGTEQKGLGHGTREMPIWGPIFSQVTTDQDFGKVRIHNLAKYLESIQRY